MNHEVREILRSLVAELGTDVNDNAQRWKGYLSDRLALYQLERQALITAMNEQVPAELLSSQFLVQPQVHIERLTQRLVDSFGLQPHVARWAVESWALALGVVQPEDLKLEDLKLEDLKRRPTIVESRTQRRKFGFPPKRLILGVAVLGMLGAIALSVPHWMTAQIPSDGGSNSELAPLKTLRVGAYINPPRPPDPNTTPQERERFIPAREGYEVLRAYLKSELSKRLGRDIDVQVEFVEITGKDSLEQAKTKLQTREWDLAFTQNPLLSIAAIESNYQFAARMVSLSGRDELQAALVTRVDSPIKSLADLNNNPNITIALEGSDHPRFYLALHDSFGRSFRVDPNNTSSRDTINKVLERKADIGVVSAQWVTGDPPPDLPTRLKEHRERYRKELRLLSSTRRIPTAGVYLSPNLRAEDKTVVRQALTEAPEEIRRAGRYDNGEPANYSEFERIVSEVNRKILACSDPNQWKLGEQVQFFCNLITGKVHSVAQVDETTSHLMVQVEGGKLIRVVLPLQVSKAAGLPGLSELNSQYLSMLNVEPDPRSQELRITDPKQVKLIKPPK
ncbi:MAG: phosphate/phosphite/phosphonate ABC transporter substrate-binding protein [Leptolyngbya sp. Prado105]|jgi:ABC-type phosphate/phosphonate transport system substrate-binding protein|nr:phosphate/phosphite/phosphonate ABC transporter substrate-binding protein [Leptolyngbya sp. Prado105]